MLGLIKAFWRLSTTREVGQGSIGGIRWTELRAYLGFYPQHDEVRWIEIIKRLDAVYLEIHREIRRQKSKEPGQ